MNMTTGDEGADPFVFHPMPVPARCCGTILQASFAEANDYCCPTCGCRVCYTCGCVERDACTRTAVSADGTRSQTYACGWAFMGLCSFCLSRAAYELYQEATGRRADDPYYVAVGRDVRAVKGLAYGV